MLSVLDESPRKRRKLLEGVDRQFAVGEGEEPRLHTLDEYGQQPEPLDYGMQGGLRVTLTC